MIDININLIIELITFFLTVFLSIFVLLDNRKNKVNTYFFLLASSISFWVASNMMADSAADYSSALFYSKLSIVWPPFLPIFFNALIYNLYYLGDRKFIARYKLINIFSLLSCVVIILFSATDLNIKSISVQSFGIDYVPGPLYYILAISLLIGFSFSFYYLAKVFIRSKGQLKRQSFNILIGAFITILLSIIINIVFPLTGMSGLNIFGPPTVIFFILFTAVAIIRHKLFNIKIIVAELLVFVMWITTLIRTVISTNLEDQLINGGMLVLIIIFGIFLIRSVMKEVNQREKIELLAKDLQGANDRLKELDKQKSEFVSFATHQLRAPLTAIKGYSSLLLEGDLGEISGKAREGVDRIYQSTNTLVNIVNDYLNITRIELGTMKYIFSSINLKNLIDEIISELSPTISNSKAVFTFSADESNYVVSADSDKLKQVFMNLIDNALKYTPSGKIEAKLTQDKSTRKIIFTVKDTGIGISAEVLPKLFQKFTRASNANTSNIKGTGLGLFVAKQIIEAHGGTIHAESSGEGKGSIFIVELSPTNY